jgi:2-amino-4-hydroxy-6-hydroxymethyldihydropteridine diphosphokinase
MVVHSVFLSVGSNIEPRAKNIVDSLKLFADAGNRVVAISSVFETEPEEVKEQAFFYNIAVSVDSHLDPSLLLRRCAWVETRMGRTRDKKSGPRNIDLDILFFDDAVIRTPDLTIPHPKMHLRRFVLEPLAEICPKKQHPVLNQSVRELLAACPTGPSVKKVGNLSDWIGSEDGQEGLNSRP